MARLIGPDEAVRLVYLTAGTNKGKAQAQGMPAVIYADASLSSLADIRSTTGDVVADSTLVVDAYSKIPLFQFPDGADTVWTSINGGPAVPLYARSDDRLDAVEAAVSDLQPGGAAEAATASALAAHAADTTSIHGIADTSVLETKTGAQSKADAAQSAAVGAAAALAIVFGA